MADGLNMSLDSYPEWPPGAAQFRAMCLGIVLDEDGNDISWQHKGAAYISYKDPRHPMNDPGSPSYVKPAIGIESDWKVSKRKEKGKQALSDMMKELK